MKSPDKNVVNIRRIIVGLDLSYMDEVLIRYAALVCKIFSIERVYFMHVAKDLELPKAIKKKYPELFAPVDEGIRRKIEEELEKYFDSRLIVEKVIEIKDGNPIEKVLKWAKYRDADMIILGRKKNLKGSGIISSKIALKAYCSILFVPENPTNNIERIAVPLDFSSHSLLAMHYALDITARTQATVACTHGYSVPLGYHKTGKGYQEFADIMQEHCYKELKVFYEKLGITKNDIPCKMILAKPEKVAKYTYKYISRQPFDLIIIGSKGRTSASSILMGSFAEKFTYINHHLPLLIAKNKGETMGFFEALMKI
ncbi:MAG: universal stress protein [Bacteroidota bacterium]